MSVKGQIKTLLPYQATVVKVAEDGHIEIDTGAKDTEIIPPVYYGGVRDSGIFMHPDCGDTLLCTRVGGGSKGVTQAIAVLAKEGGGVRHDANAGTVPIGSAPYPLIKQGDVKLLSNGGSELFLKGDPLNSEIHLTTSKRCGLFVSSDLTSVVTSVGNLLQNVSSGSRLITGDVIRNPGGGQTDVSVGHDIECFSKLSGERRGFFEGADALDSSLLGSPRNPVLSEYRLVVNEFSERSAFTGFDQEHAVAMSSDKKEYTESAHKAAIDSRTSLSLAPHQLVEIIAGNVINSRGEALDINYGTVEVGDSSGKPVQDEASYERDMYTSRRGIGYHFQLSTNSKSKEVSNDVTNFVCAIDKMGLVKVNVPKGSGVGNVLFPTDATFGRDSGGTLTKPLAPSLEEDIPITLRKKDGKPVLPQIPPGKDIDGGGKRDTGVRFSNHDNYFQNGFRNLPEGTVRVNFTAHHNMYAAAEMLIANLIRKVSVPKKGTELPGFVMGTAVGECFERYYGELDDKGNLKDNELKYMSTVAVKPGPPALYPGGGTIVAGLSSLDQADGANQPYTNSFVITGSSGKFAWKTEGSESEVGGGPQDPGGKSANINFEGAVDISVGKDNFDQKSLVLDTAGGVISWFGRDAHGRSLIAQTDGDVMLNVGGRSFSDGVNKFNAGRFDLRVNVTDKGTVSQGKDGVPREGANASDYIISISDAGLVIAGMAPGQPMVIRNAGPLSIESTDKMCLVATSVEIREGNQSPRKTHKAPTSKDQKPLDAEGVAETTSGIAELMATWSDEDE